MRISRTLRRTTRFNASDVAYDSSYKYLFFDNKLDKLMIFDEKTEAEAYADSLGREYEHVYSQELVSDSRKAVCLLRDPQIYHFFLDFFITVYSFLKIYRNSEDHEIVLFQKDKKRTKSVYYGVLAGLLAIFTKFNVKHVLMGNTSSSDKIYQIKNFYMIRPQSDFSEDESYTFKDLNEMLNDLNLLFGSNTTPTKRVYISRAKARQDAIDQYRGTTLDAPIRLSGALEDAVETTLRSHGFEVLIPEERFTSLDDQIRFMSEVSVLVAPSGSGLTNMLFMPSGGTVLELATEIETRVDGDTFYTEHVAFFNALAFARDHIHVMLQLPTQSSDAVSRLMYALKLIDSDKAP